MSDKLFGWELLFNNVKNDIKKKEDLLLLVIHYSLIKTGFKCVGVNDDWKSEENEISSELLPKNWNEDKEFVFRYKYDSEKYSLRSCHSDNSTIIFNLMQSDKLKVSNVIFNYAESVKALQGAITDLLPNYEEILEAVKRDLISPYVTSAKKSTETQTLETEPRLRQSTPSTVYIPPPSRNDFESEFDFRSVGRSDLHPFGGIQPFGRGGNLFDPFSNRRPPLDPGPGVPDNLPDLARPPGARFDPFGPPDSNLRPGPTRFPPEYDDIFS